MPRQRRRRDLDGIYERPDSPYYWASYINASGQRVRRSTGIGKSIEGRREAEALLAKWTLEAHRERQWDEQPRHSFEELMRDYLTATAGEGRSERTFRLHVRRLRQTFQGVEMEALSAAHIAAYIRRRKSEAVSNTTVNRELEVLSAAINHAVREWEWRLPNPVPGRMLKEPERLYAEHHLPPQLPTTAWRMSIPVYNNERWIGYASSGCWSPWLKKYIALAHVPAHYALPGTPLSMEVTVEHQRRQAAARVTKLPFYEPERKRF